MFGCSKCLCIVSRMNILALSTPLFVRYTNWKGSIRELVTSMIGCLTILSIAFITSEVRATGLKSLSTFGNTFLGDGDHCQVFPQLGNCTIVHRFLEQDLKYTSQLLSTVPQNLIADAVWAK